jgi:hypothetical protein
MQKKATSGKSLVKRSSAAPSTARSGLKGKPPSVLKKEPNSLLDGRDAGAEGSEAYYAGRSDTANPFPHGNDQHLEWNDGYAQAMENDRK